MKSARDLTCIAFGLIHVGPESGVRTHVSDSADLERGLSVHGGGVRCVFGRERAGYACRVRGPVVFDPIEPSPGRSALAFRSDIASTCGFPVRDSSEMLQPASTRNAAWISSSVVDYLHHRGARRDGVPAGEAAGDRPLAPRRAPRRARRPCARGLVLLGCTRGVVSRGARTGFRALGIGGAGRVARHRA